MAPWRRRTLLGRYHRAIELMDSKLADFYSAARGAGLLDDTLLIVTSDHGEAFGEHDLYLHDASVYDTHLHVPLWIHHPTRAPAVVDDVVSTQDLFGLICNAIEAKLGKRRPRSGGPPKGRERPVAVSIRLNPRVVAWAK